MTPAQFKYESHEVLSNIKWDDVLEYPPGINELREPRSVDEIQATLKTINCRKALALEGMYSHFDGLSWPDIRNGYFINSIAHNDYRRPNEPQYILARGSDRRSVLEIGSGGGGELILFDCDSGMIVICVGARKDAGTLSNPSEFRVVADDIDELLEVLMADLCAFARGEENDFHTYMI